MCNYLKKQGRAWAVETLVSMSGMTDTKAGRAQVVARIALGKEQKPESYAVGVQSLIDDLQVIEARAA